MKFYFFRNLPLYLPTHALISSFPPFLNSSSRHDQDDLERGYTELSGGPKPKFVCLSCGKWFPREQQIKIHYNVHFGEKVYECNLKGCNMKFAHLAVFESHLERRHRNKRQQEVEEERDESQLIQDLHDDILSQMKQEEADEFSQG